MTGPGNGGWRASPWFHAALVGVVSVVVIQQYGLHEYPLRGDRAYFVHLAQLVLAGKSIYTHSFMGYPPLALLVAAAAMEVGGWFGVPTYLSPRVLGVLVAAASAIALYAVARRACGRAWIGLLASCILISFSEYGALSVAGLEPKSLVILFSLLACAAAQRMRWFLVGLFAGLSLACWQPAGLVGLVGIAAVVWGGRVALVRNVARYAAGAALGLLPAVLYLFAVDGWWDFWQRSVVIPATLQLPGAGARPGRWLDVGRAFYPNEWGFFLAAGAGFGAFAVASLRRGGRGVLDAWLGPTLGVAPLLTLGWAAFNSVEFQGAPDMFPILPWLALWAAWLVSLAATGIARLSRSPTRGWARAAIALVLGAALVYGTADAFRYVPAATLAEERALVLRLVAPAGRDENVFAFDAEAVYALSGRISPLPFLRLNASFDPFLPLVEPAGCDAMRARMHAANPAVVVSRDWGRRRRSRPRQGACLGRFERELLQRGYRHRKVGMALGSRVRFVPSEVGSVVSWNVYTRPDAIRRAVRRKRARTDAPALLP